MIPGMAGHNAPAAITGQTITMHIRTKLISTADSCVDGDMTLVEQWRGEADSILWLDIEGEISDTMREELLELGCHPLAIKDIQQARRPPKIRVFEQQTFILFRGIVQLDEFLNLDPQQIGLFCGLRLLVTIHRGESLSINRVWTEGDYSGNYSSPGMLARQIMYLASGRYLDRILEFEAHLGELEDSLLTGQSEKIMAELVSYRSELRKLRRIFSYHLRLAEEIIEQQPSQLEADSDEQLHLWRSLMERCERLYSLTSMYYEICGDLVEGYISISSHQLNNTMKILTIITAIFVPMTFIAGIYGMNFENMPELQTRYGYFFALGVMIFSATVLLYMFKRKRWL
jgi:magnesium transporter